MDSGWKNVGKDPAVPQADHSNLCDQIDAACARPRDHAASTMAMIHHAINDAEI